ncbi:MAG: hypothetical protein RSD40_02255 [Bacilli bacterium]|uniref:hypothetical protein n=1 Tax=Carnobacterium sp. TaxID=48221 RepID=UPI002FCBF520
MYPVGTYEDFKIKVAIKENKGITSIFGVLFLNYNQQGAKEYIVDFLDIFHKNSGSYINFYVPGYIKEGNQYQVNDRKKIDVGLDGESYYFSLEEYKKICSQFKDIYKIKFPFNPMLLICEINGNHEILEEKKLVINLHDDKNSIENASKKIEQVIQFSKNGVNNTKEMNKKILFQDFKEYFTNGIFEDVDNPWIKVVNNVYKIAKK